MKKCYWCRNEAKDVLCLENKEQINSCRKCTIKTGSYVIDNETGNKVFIPIIK